MIDLVDPVLLSSAFAAGLVTFFNPCAYAMLPAYISYQFSRGGKIAQSAGWNILRGAGTGLAVSLGFVFVFLALGEIVSFTGIQVSQYLPWGTVVIGMALILLGVLWLANVKMSVSISPRVPKSGGLFSFFIFGAGYAVASAACALPVFLMVVSTAVSSGGFLSGLVIFLAYSLGMIVVMVPTAIAVSASKNLALNRFESVMSNTQKIGAIIMVLAGIYLIYTQKWVFGV